MCTSAVVPIQSVLVGARSKSGGGEAGYIYLVNLTPT